MCVRMSVYFNINNKNLLDFFALDKTSPLKIFFTLWYFFELENGNISTETDIGSYPLTISRVTPGHENTYFPRKKKKT